MEEEQNPWLSPETWLQQHYHDFIREAKESE